MNRADRRLALAYGALAVMLVFVYQFLIVRFGFDSNWTSFFCTGGNYAEPPTLASERIYVFPRSNGYDSQFYHYEAHDPLARQGLAQYIDAPRLRYRRILVPGLAHLITAGQSQYIDAGLIAVNLLFVFAGAYWLSRYVRLAGYPAGWGLLFLLFPAVLVSIDRLTVDLALTALCVAFGLYLAEQQSLKLYGIMMLAALARETGLLLAVSYSIAQLLDGKIKRPLLFATSAVPALAWYGFVHAHTTSYRAAGWFTPVPFGGVLRWIIHPPKYPFSPPVAWTATVLDECALAGMVVAIFLSLRFPRPARLRPMAIGALLMALSAVNLGPVFWDNAFAFGRVFSPVLIFIALAGCFTKSWAYVLPIALITPRIALQLAYDALRIMRG